MASLVLVTREGRLFLKIGGVIFGILFVIFLFVQGGTMMRDLFFPKPPPAPMEAFGDLPSIIFPASTPSTITYNVNTINGALPTLPDRVYVYKIKTNSPNLLALQDAKSTLDSANFVENQVKISDTIYRFAQARTGIVIEYDIVSKNFTISSNFFTNPSLVSTGLLPSEESIKADLQSFLQTINANVKNIDFEKTKVEYLESQNGGLIAATNLGSARFARVTLYQNTVDETPIVYGAPGESLLNFIVSYPGSSFRPLEGIFFNHEVNIDEKSDYPIKTAQMALEELKTGKASYVINPQNKTVVDITDVKLKYYLTRENQGYLLPIIEFTGANFTAYVDATLEGLQSSPSPQ